MIKKYKLKNGDTRYMFHSYIGIDPVTDKDVYRKRSGFKTKKEAEIAEELTEIIKMAKEENKEEYYFNEVIQPILDETAIKIKKIVTDKKTK